MIWNKQKVSTHGGLDSGDVRLGQAGGWRTLRGVNGWVSGDGSGASSAVWILDVSATITAGAAAFLQPAGRRVAVTKRSESTLKAPTEKKTKKTKKHTHTDPSCWWAMCRYCVGWPGRPIPTGAGRDPRRTRWWAGTRILGNRWADRRRSWSCSSGLVWRSECSLALGYGYAGKPAPAVGRPTAHAHILGSPTGTKLGKKKIIFHILKRPESTVLRYFFKINCTCFNTQPPRGTRPLRSPLKY